MSSWFSSISHACVFQRMIVEFSLENRKALETQERRKEKIEVNVHLVPVIVMISAGNCND